VVFGDKNGSIGQTKNPPSQPHEKIEISNFSPAGFISKAKVLYKEGHSLQSIAALVNVPRSTLRSALIDDGVSIRARSHDQVRQSNGKKKRAINSAPYGYAISQGRVVVNPAEMDALALIYRFWTQDLGQTEIATRLNRSKIKPRRARAWNQPVILYLIRRFQSEPNFLQEVRQWAQKKS
jgi:hypothetical protein